METMPATPTATLLAIEDDPLVRRNIRAYLEDSGFAIREAADGQEGVDLFRRERPDLVLTDLRMPGLPGLEVIDLIRSEAPDLPILVVSGTGRMEDALEAVRRGAWDFVTKPIPNMAALELTIRRALERARLLRENRAHQLHLEQMVQEAVAGQRETHAKLAATLRAIPDPLFEVDQAGRLYDYHALEPGLLYAPPEDFLGKTVAEVLPATASRVILEALNEAARQGWHRGATYSLEMPDGRRWFELSVAIKGRLEAGETRFIVSARDITERVQAVEALAENEARFRSTFEDAPIGLYRTTPDGRILMANPALCRMMGYASLEALQEVNLETGFRASYKRADFKREVEAQGVITGLESNWTRLDGTVVTVRENARAVRDASGQVLYYDGTIEDVTDRRRAEELIQAQYQQLQAQHDELMAQDKRLRQAEVELRQVNAELERRVADRTGELSLANAALARAARLKDEFLASMSHELRTPLTAVLGLAESLQIGTYGPLAKAQVQPLQIIMQSGQHLLTLINDILDLSKAEAGKMELQIGPVVVDEICQASLRLVQEMAIKRGQTVAYDFDPAVNVLPGDGRRLKQMLVNLLSNAIKFTPVGGALGLEVRGDREQQVVRLTVWDTGIGIAPENLGKLFRPFVQLDSGLARQYSGTGLGLSLVARMAELHGGSVSAESAGVPGQGSRFTILLPWTDELPVPGARAADVPASDPTRSGAPVILVADDNEITCNTLKDYLEGQGYRVEIAHHGGEAVERAHTARPALALMDIQMPDVDGLEAIRQLRADKDRQLARLPIVALTALTMPGDRESCLEAGADDYLTKPVNLLALNHAIRDRLNRSP